MNEGEYEIIRLLIQSVDQKIMLDFADGTSRTIPVDPEKLLLELDKDQRLEKEADWLARRLAEFCDPDHDNQCCVLCRENCNGVDCEEWRDSARKAVKDETNA